jgi:hypothetical protein
MGQTWTADTYDSTHVAATDLGNIKTNFATIRSLFSGSSAPGSPVVGQPWFDTTKKLVKIRNASDDAWLGIMYGSTSLKTWIYANAAGDGWVIDSSITDRVLALKGGSTYTAGGATAGSWTVSGLAHTHTGPSHTHTGPSHYHAIPETGWSAGANANGAQFGGSAEGSNRAYGDTGAAGTGATGAAGTGATGSAGTQDGAWRVAAAVGTLQYPNV